MFFFETNTLTSLTLKHDDFVFIKKNMEGVIQMDEDTILKELYVSNGDIINRSLIENQNDNSHDCRISDETYVFLKQKLNDANSTIASYSQREINFKDELDRLKRENHDKQLQITNVKNELQSYRAKQLNIEQKLESETRARFTFQDKSDELEKEVSEKILRNNFLEEQLKDTNLALTQSENLTENVYKVATDACNQNHILKEQTQILEEMLKVLKTKLSDTQSENKFLKTDIAFIKERHNELENDYEESSSEIEFLKEEAAKQEMYINDTLNRFQEIGIHFTNMKTHFIKQHKTLETYHEEILKKSSEETCHLVVLNEKIKNQEEEKQKSNLRELEMKNKMTKLEDTLDAMLVIRGELEHQNKLHESQINDTREKYCDLRNENEKLKTLMSVNKNSFVEKEKQLAEIKRELEAWRCKNEDLLKKKDLSNGEITKLKCDSETMLNEKFNLTNENESLKEELRKCKSELDILKKENFMLCEEMKKREHEIEAIYNEGNNVEECLKQKHSEFMKLKENHENIQKQNIELQSNINELSRKIENLLKLKTDDEKQVNDLEEKLNKCQRLLMENDEKLMQLNTDNTGLKCKLHEALAANDKLNGQVDHLKLVNKDNNNELHSTKNEITELRQTYDNLMIEKENMREKLSENLKRITLVMQEDEAKLRSQILIKTEENEKLIQDIKTNEEHISNDKIQFLQINERINFLSNKNENLTEELEKQLQAKDVLKESIEKKEIVEIEQQNKIGKLSDDVKKFSTKLNAKQHDFQSLEEKISSCQLQWETLHEQVVSDLKEELGKEYMRNKIQMDTDSLWDE